MLTLPRTLTDCPGWAEPLHGEFDPREASIIAAIRNASYRINREAIPAPPTPSPPAKIWWTDKQHLCWTGAPWAASYIVVVKNTTTGEERQKQVVDCTKEGCLSIDLTNELGGWQRSQVTVRMRSLSSDGAAGSDSYEVKC